MSLLSTLLLPWTAQAPSRLTVRLALLCDRPRRRFREEYYRARPGRGNRTVDASRQSISCEKTFEDRFIRSLITAGSCHQHAFSTVTSPLEQGDVPRRRRRTGTFGQQQKRCFSVKPRSAQTATPALAPGPEISKEEYKDLVDTYHSASDMGEQPEEQRRRFRGLKFQQPPHHAPLAPRPVIPVEQEDKPPNAPREVLTPKHKMDRLNLKWLKGLLRHPSGSVPHTKLWTRYTSLRGPQYIPDVTLRLLFRHLARTQYEHAPEAADRYFALLDECVNADIPLINAEWNSAIAFAGRSTRWPTSNEVKRAIETWMRMENSGHRADNVTFSIIFDVAVKAGHFALAEKIHNELKVRGMELNRYFRVSMIYYAGMRGDGNFVRRAFNDLVNAGEIVDTNVMDCVIQAFIRAGEAPAAEQAFMKMKELHAAKFGTKGPDDWRKQRELFKLLNQTGRRLRKERKEHESSFFGGRYSSEDRKEEIQRTAPIAPDATTYRILLRHHIYTSGDMARVEELIAEMKEQSFKVQGSVYAHLFRGFQTHGGYAFATWRPSLLEKYWKEFLAVRSASDTCPKHPEPTERTLEELLASMNTPGKDGHGKYEYGEHVDDYDEDDLQQEVAEQDCAPYFTRMLAIGVVKAYNKCLGRRKMLEVWEEIKDRWKEMPVEERRILQGVVERLCLD